MNLGCFIDGKPQQPIPPVLSAHEAEIAAFHSDYGSITLLFQRPGQPGLEIIPPELQTPDRDTTNTAAWTPVPVSPPGTENDLSPPILVNIGDLLEYWTNGLFKSTVHRVIFPQGNKKEGGRDRYSIAYFCHALPATVLKPVPSERVKALEGGKGVFHVDGRMTAGEHLQSRLKATYLGLYKEGEEKPEEEVATS